MMEHQEDSRDGKSVYVLPEKGEEKAMDNCVAENPDEILKGAQNAMEKEQTMSFVDGIRKYSKACA